MSFSNSTYDRLANLCLCIALAVASCLISGCQSWQLSDHLPGSGLTKKERQIVERVDSDPFPTPEQVGIETK